MQSLTSGSIFLRQTPTHLPKNQRAEPGRAGWRKPPVENRGTRPARHSGRPPRPAAGIDHLLGDLGRWTADARAADAASARSRERSLRRQAAEEATASGIALDMVERGAPVVLRTTSGRTHRARLVAVARDFWMLGPEESYVASGSTGIAGATLVAVDAIATLRAQPADGDEPPLEASGARPVPIAVSLTEVMGDLATEHPWVRIVVLGEPEAIVGQLRSVGADVATLRVTGVAPTTVYVRLGSVTELSVLGSG